MDFRPWMMETAYSFIRGSRVLWENNLIAPSMVNVALGLEVLFKSFNATVDGTPGGIGEQYQVASNLRHSLLHLFDAIPETTRAHLGLHTYRDYFGGRTDKLFVLARYPYERGGMAGGGSAIIEVAEEIFDRVMREYKQGGCKDPWIVAFPSA